MGSTGLLEERGTDSEALRDLGHWKMEMALQFLECDCLFGGHLFTTGAKARDDLSSYRTLTKSAAACAAAKVTLSCRPASALPNPSQGPSVKPI